jgi:hypothetical protein
MFLFIFAHVILLLFAQQEYNSGVKQQTVTPIFIEILIGQ